MIFVTVGTERYPFDRLLRAVDDIRGTLSGEAIFMQTGTSTYAPSCDYQRYLSFHEFRKKIREARIVVSHAGAGTLLQCVQAKKIPIMLARKHRFHEHIDDHQSMFAKKVSQRGLIFLAEDEFAVQDTILRYDELSQSLGDRPSTEPALVSELTRLLSDISSWDTIARHSS